MLKQTLSTLLCAGILTLSASGQNTDGKKNIVTKNAPQGTITLTTQSMAGIGPSGNSSMGISPYDPYDNEGEQKAFPKMKNKPLGLHGTESYFFILDGFQFFFQNYSQAVFSKDFFMEKAAIRKWRLEDTVKMSRKPLKVGISVLTGYNDANELFYVIDANSNGDFGDDVLRPIAINAYSIDAAMATPVYTEYLAGKEIKNEKILLFLIASKRGRDDDKLDMLFAFPQFKYARFEYNGQPYFAVTEMGKIDKHITLMPDVPNFSSTTRNGGTQLGQFVRIGDADFQFAGLSENGNKITLTGKDVSGFTVKKPLATKIPQGPTAALADAFSSQLGYKAPIIKGNNVNPLAKHITGALSTADLKGKYVFVDFWSSTCVPCIAEFPNLKAAYDKFDRSKFEIVGVLDERDQGITQKLIGEGRMTWPTIVTNVKGTETKGYNISSYPTTYLIDPQGKIIALDLRGDDLMNKLNALIKL